MKTKFLQTLLPFLILILTIPLTTKAYSFQAGGLCYITLLDSDSTVKVTFEDDPFNGDYVSGSIDIPSIVADESGRWYTVTSIGDLAFSGCSGLTSVTIPNSVTTIGFQAFTGCSGLTSVTIPNSVTMIDGDAFWYCTGLTSVTIGNSVTYIGAGAFADCTGLTSVTIPNSVTTIGLDAFYGCSGLTSVTISNSVDSIAYQTFYGCTGLTSVTIPNSVTTIEGSAFEGCTALKAVQVLATTPPSNRNSSNFFSDDTYSQATLYIPKGCLDAYRRDKVWGQFFNNVESSFIKGDVNLDETVDTGDATALANHLLNAKSVPHFSADINGDNQVDISDVSAIISIILSE